MHSIVLLTLFNHYFSGVYSQVSLQIESKFEKNLHPLLLCEY